MKKSRDLIVFLAILLLAYLMFVHKSQTPTNSGLGAECMKHQCGGFVPVGSQIPTCPKGCKCGEVNPMIPDAPRKCMPE